MKNKNIARKESLMGVVLIEDIVSLDRWYATTFSTLFFPLIGRLNSWNSKINCSNLGLASYLDIKYIITA